MTEEQAREIRNSDHWAWVKDELDLRISGCVSRLVHAKYSELIDLQRKIKLYEEFKKLPDDVIDREAAPTVPDQPQMAR